MPLKKNVGDNQIIMRKEKWVGNCRIRVGKLIIWNSLIKYVYEINFAPL